MYTILLTLDGDWGHKIRLIAGRTCTITPSFIILQGASIISSQSTHISTTRGT